MPDNGDRRRNPETGKREIYFDPPGTWEILGVATTPDERVPDEELRANLLDSDDQP